ncbi:MAG: flagellar motor protein [Herbaspirillum sp.]
MLAGQMLEGGRMGSLVQPAAFVIVVVGTIGAVLLQSGLANFARGTKMLVWVFTPPAIDYEALLRDVGIWSFTARREGLLSLERFMERTDDPFIEKGLRLLIDGTDPTKLREIMEIETTTYEATHRQALKIWEAAGGYAPTIGILGAVMGLIHVMENLSDPSKLGAGIAVAFVATIYGVGFANLLFLPVANRLKSVLAQQTYRMDMLVDALSGIATGDNPRVIDERLRAYFK